MSKEILDAVRELEVQKGIDADVLLTALEEALGAAYRKTPDAKGKHARVVIDRENGDFRVMQIDADEDTLDDLGLLTWPDIPTAPETPAPAAPQQGVLPIVTNQFATVTVVPNEEIRREDGHRRSDGLAEATLQEGEHEQRRRPCEQERPSPVAEASAGDEPVDHRPGRLRGRRRPVAVEELEGEEPVRAGEVAPEVLVARAVGQGGMQHLVDLEPEAFNRELALRFGDYLGETAAFGLRMNEGWGFEEFQRITGFDLRTHWRADMAALVRENLAVQTSERFQLTPRGLRFADYAAEKFLRSHAEVTPTSPQVSE